MLTFFVFVIFIKCCAMMTLIDRFVACLVAANIYDEMPKSDHCCMIICLVSPYIIRLTETNVFCCLI